MERSLKWIRRAIAGLFIALTLWMGYWSAIAGPGLATHPRNPRLTRVEAGIKRGGIFARGGEGLSVTLHTGSEMTRAFVGPDSLSHVVGYADARYGKTGLEAAFDEYLKGAVGLAAAGSLVVPALGGAWSGWDLVTTVDLRLQQAAAEAMAGRRGALVVMDPWDGEILAMVSVPGYDPRRLAEYFSGQSGDEASLFNRATQGQYPPGSAFKPVVLAAALETGVARPAELYVDGGSIRIGHRTIHNASGEAHGLIALDDALARSSNVVFASLAAKLKASDFHEIAGRFGAGRRPGIEIAAAAGRLPGLDELEDEVARAEVGIGQGSLLVTPLQMAQIAAAVANGGYRVEPTLLLALRTPGGESRSLERPAREPVMSAGTAQVIKEAMTAAARWGTARGVAWPGAQTVAGKTGTAENPHGEPHAWFIGFYPAEDPRIALAVVVENGGFGSAVAVPIARSVFMAWDRAARESGYADLP